jgi:60 kDa SS-A/Ro ribonucleoprotein
MSKKTPYVAHVTTVATPQSEPVPGKAMAANNAGGYAFALDDWKRLDRFLVLGAEGGTYYVSERALTQENAGVVLRCLAADTARTINQIVAVSDAGRAPKNDPAIFALALASAHAPIAARGAVWAALPKVCRTGAHLFQFVAAADSLRGWGAGLRKAVGGWYTDKTPDELAYQVTKYQQRNGWSHRDVLRLASPRPGDDPARASLFRWIATGAAEGERTVTRGTGEQAKTRTYASVSAEALPESVRALESLRKAVSAKEVVSLIKRYADKAPRELVPTQFLAEARVWAALLSNMPMTAMLRNLATMTRVGLLAPLSDATRTVCERLRDSARLKKARVHPLSILVALKTYESGKSVKGDGEWKPVPAVVDALNDAFYLAFDAVEPSGKRWMFGLDVSGSMGALISGMPVSCCEAATALALVSTRIEPYTFVGAFSTAFTQLRFGNSTRLDEALRQTRNQNFGGTDCSLPMTYAMQNKIQADVFCVLTDSETWAGNIHPFQALKKYRDKTGIDAKLVVVGMTSNGFTIADPSDPGMFDCVGFDTAVPALMADFARTGFSS